MVVIQPNIKLLFLLFSSELQIEKNPGENNRDFFKQWYYCIRDYLACFTAIENAEVAKLSTLGCRRNNTR